MIGLAYFAYKFKWFKKLLGDILRILLDILVIVIIEYRVLKTSGFYSNKNRARRFRVVLSTKLHAAKKMLFLKLQRSIYAKGAAVDLAIYKNVYFNQAKDGVFILSLYVKQFKNKIIRPIKILIKDIFKKSKIIIKYKLIKITTRLEGAQFLVSFYNKFDAPKSLTRILRKIWSKAEKFLILSRWNKQYLISLINSHVICYPTPICLTYAWSFGSLAGFCLIIQIISGIFLSMHYTPDINLAFKSVEFIMRDVPNGWLIRYIHANGSSMFFIVVYGHICRGLYYGSYIRPRQLLWCSGVVLLLLMMATAFTGYVLPWGQMSFWGATVITSMVTIIPIAGENISQWLWGGYTVGNPTLKRFFAIHFFLPFIIVGFTFIHLALLHKVGSNSPIGSDVGVDDIPFFPYFFTKDAFAFACFLIVFAILVLYFPNALSHPDNYIPANPMKTPAHVVPEWYFLPYYAILRSIPHKTSGILAMLGSILVLFVIPFINTSEIRNTTFRPIFKICFWLFVADFVILTWIGEKPVKNTYIFAGQVATTYYFLFFLILIPVVGLIESKLVKFKPDAKK